MLHQTIEKLHALKLSAMADGVLAQMKGVYAQTLGMFQSLLKSMAYCENCQRAVVCQSFQKSLKRSAASWV
jgi:hypothetical protein